MRILKLGNEEKSYQLDGRWPAAATDFTAHLTALDGLLPGLEVEGRGQVMRLFQPLAMRYAEPRPVADLGLTSGRFTVIEPQLVAVFDAIAATDSCVPMCELEMLSRLHGAITTRRGCPWPDPATLGQDLRQLECDLKARPHQAPLTDARFEHDQDDDDLWRCRLHFATSLAPENQASEEAAGGDTTTPLFPAILTALAAKWAAKLVVVVKTRTDEEISVGETEIELGDRIVEAIFLWDMAKGSSQDGDWR